MYSEMYDANKQAFGDIFKGPWLTSQMFDLAKEWDIQAAHPGHDPRLARTECRTLKSGRLTRQDHEEGAASDLINEIRKMGPEEGQAFLDNLMKAKPGQINALVAQWRRRNKNIEAATKMDFSDQIKQFKNAGIKMGDAMVDGLESAQVAKRFDAWATSHFPGVINKQYDGWCPAAAATYCSPTIGPSASALPSSGIGVALGGGLALAGDRGAGGEGLNAAVVRAVALAGGPVLPITMCPSSAAAPVEPR